MFQNIFITNGDDTGQPPQVYLWDDKKGLQILPWSKFNYAFVKSSTGQYKSIFGDSLEKISKRKTKQYNAEDVFESDVPRETRVLIDRYLNDDSVSTNHCLGIIDIETDSSGGFPNIQEADKQIVSIAGYNNNTDVTTVFALPPIPGIFSDFVSGKTEYKFFNSEYDLLLQFLLWWNAQNFTILTHWNGDNFDVPYLYRRLCRVHDEDTANMLSPIGIVRYSEFRNRFQIAGVSSIDYMVAFKKYTLGSRPSYRLGAIAQEIVGETKVEYEGSLNDLYVNNFEKFLEYNIQDVHLIKRMDDKLKYIDLIQNICHISHVPYEDFQYSSRFIEGTILTYLHRKNVISPNKHANHRQLMNNRFETDDNAFEGAYVKDPVVGLHEWVFSLDVESLYPSVMRSLNISAEKKVGKILNFDTQEKIQNKEKTYDVILRKQKYSIQHTDVDEFLLQNQLAVSSNGILYEYDAPGVIPEVLSSWFETRKKFKDLAKKFAKENDTEKEQYYDKLQNVYKVFLNCFSPDHDVMTIDGQKNITDLKVGDLVYSINPDTFEVEIKPVTKTYEYDYDGPMVAIKTNHIDFLVTPNHRFYTRLSTSKKWKWREASEFVNESKNTHILPPHVPLTHTVDYNTYDLKASCLHYGIPFVCNCDRLRSDRSSHNKLQPWEYKMEDWLEFLGWFISEGSLYSSSVKTYESGNVRGVYHKIDISQHQLKYQVKIENLLNRMGIEYYKHSKGVSFCHEPIYKILEIETGKGAYNKRIPSWVFGLPKDKLVHLYNSLMWGDGDADKKRYTTASDQLSLDFIRLLHHIGLYGYRLRKTENVNRIQVCLERGLNSSFRLKSRVKTEAYKGKVYCVEVADNHTLLCGRNTKLNWCGQSIYGSLGLPSFRFYDLDNSEAVTLTGQEIIKGSEVYTKEIYRHHYSTPPETSNVIYIDTDSLYISALPALTNSLTYQEKIDTTKTLSRIVETGLNNFYPVFLNRIFGIPSANNKIRIKSESIAKSTLFIAKKRYALAKVYDLEKDMPISDTKPPEIKGIDVRRSTFPKKFKEFMTGLLKDILDGATREKLDIKVLDLLETLPQCHYTEIAIGKGVKAVSKYDDTRISTFVDFTKGTPSHVKAAITHNRLMDEWDETGIERIKNDDKIKYVWLKPNPYQIDVVAFKGYNDSHRLIEFIQEYIDPQEIFMRELEKKLQSIYDALSFGLVPSKQNQTANKYFTWD